MICPNCGAYLDVTKNSGKVKCSFCFTKFPAVHLSQDFSAPGFPGNQESAWDDEDDYYDEVFENNKKFSENPAGSVSTPSVSKEDKLKTEFDKYYKIKRLWNICDTIWFILAMIISALSCILIELELTDIGAPVFLIDIVLSIALSIGFAQSKPVPPPPAKKPSKLVNFIAQLALSLLFVFLGMLIIAIILVV